MAFVDLNSFGRPDPGMLKTLFNLTNAEAEVATQIALGRSTAAIAAQLGSAVGTVRVQLKSAMMKTKTNRQSELAAVVTRACVLSQGEFVSMYQMNDNDEAG